MPAYGSGNTRMLNPPPSAGKVGMGSGNVPFAPGLMSGSNLGQQTNPQPLARQATAPRPAEQGSSPPAAPKGQVPPPGGQQGQPPPAMAQGNSPAGLALGVAPNQNPWPAIYMKILDAYLKAIFESKDKPLIGNGGMY